MEEDITKQQVLGKLDEIAALKITAVQSQYKADALLRLAIEEASIAKDKFMFSIPFDENNPICVKFDTACLTHHGILKNITFIDGKSFFDILATNNLQYSQPTNLVKYKCVEDKLEIAEQITKWTLENKEK